MYVVHIGGLKRAFRHFIHVWADKENLQPNTFWVSPNEKKYTKQNKMYSLSHI